jgi:magnesium-transporting ATPase (P-type)
MEIRDLVVEDIVEINYGGRFPADCILINKMNITGDQSIYNSKEFNIDKNISKYNRAEATEVVNHTNQSSCI